MVAFGNDISGACVDDRAVINLQDAYADARFNRVSDIKTLYRTRSLLCAPVSRVGVSTLYEPCDVGML